MSKSIYMDLIKNIEKLIQKIMDVKYFSSFSLVTVILNINASVTVNSEGGGRKIFRLKFKK